MARLSLAQFPYALAFLAAGTALPAQGLLGVPASDPAGIARSGAGVAFGRSLEAASLNPALLVTLPGKGGASTTAWTATASCPPSAPPGW
jgi:hypothetical protein